MLSGIIYTARDKVHSLVSDGDGEWPFPLKDNCIFYSGPTPRSEGFPLGSCGPTTSARMDDYTPGLYRKGLAATIGKGPRSEKVREAIKHSGGLYLVAYGGCGALYGSRVTGARVIGFAGLGPQAVYKVSIEDFPVIVGIDSYGGDIFKEV
ncbi:MAG: fumarate hydratase C-terminal domain-containing protein [Elusimicrobia bacterium]|nr:fumarate hydratase C-terminal domain-containing protein [Elusimicrobiota bacterium]